jgi:hypothetical protein
MKPAKRMEIVVDAIIGSRVLRELEQAGAGGYTVIRDAGGAGHRGERRNDELTGVSTNWYILCAMDPALVEPITHRLRPLLKQHGGICLVSDCHWINH